ncbi:MAG: hypothetical protein IPP88_03190 [Betaproteobacteria bacterium]|nr:hypothetical protein [Betaproteobacteria bacterium]
MLANNGSDTLSVIDGDTGTVAGTVNTGLFPRGVAVNPVTNKIYVSNSIGNSVTVIDGATLTTATVSTGASPDAVAVNPVTNKTYVANNGGTTVTVIDGANGTATINVGTNPVSIAVNVVTNRIYVGNSSGGMTVIDGDTNATSTVTAGTTGPHGVTVNPATNKIYVVNNGNHNVTIVDGASGSKSTVATGLFPFGVAVNPVTGKIYVANSSGGTVTVITESLMQAIPLTTAIGSLPGNQTGLASPTFTFTPASTFVPTVPPVQGVYYQIDTWQGAWQKAGGTGLYTGTTAPLGLGTHILYAFAVDGQESTSVSTGVQASPLVGQMAAYVFTVSAQTPPLLQAVQSRKVHGTAGPFDLPVNPLTPITGAITVEPRFIGTGHTLVFQFDKPIGSIGAVSAVDASSASIGTATADRSGNEVVVTLTDIANNRRVRVSLNGVNGSVNASASLGFLVGDVNNSQTTTSTDLTALKARGGQAAAATTFWYDLNASGSVTAADIATMKARVGQILAP